MFFSWVFAVFTGFWPAGGAACRNTFIQWIIYKSIDSVDLKPWKDLRLQWFTCELILFCLYVALISKCWSPLTCILWISKEIHFQLKISINVQLKIKKIAHIISGWGLVTRNLLCVFWGVNSCFKVSLWNYRFLGGELYFYIYYFIWVYYEHFYFLYMYCDQHVKIQKSFNDWKDNKSL